jgi:hypothetical protein
MIPKRSDRNAVFNSTEVLKGLTNRFELFRAGLPDAFGSAV